MNAYRNASFVGIVLFCLGIGVGVYGWFFIEEERALDQKGEIVSGKVFDIEKRDLYRQPWVVFSTREGKEVRFLSKLMVDMTLFKYQIGQEVEVIYDPANPAKTAEINAFFERNTRQLVSLGIGGVLTLFGLVFWRGMRKKAQRFDAEQRGEVAPDPDAGKNAANRAALIAFLVICLIIGIFVFVYGKYGNSEMVWGPVEGGAGTAAGPSAQAAEFAAQMMLEEPAQPADKTNKPVKKPAEKAKAKAKPEQNNEG